MATCSSTFRNDTEFPVVVESYIRMSPYSYTYTLTGPTVMPGETVVIPSDNGEWYLNNLLVPQELFQIWKDAGYSSIGRIGKYRNKQANGEWSWMVIDDFSITNENGIFVFRKRNKE